MEQSGAPRFSRRQSVAQYLIPGRPFEQAFQQCTQIKSGAAREHGQLASCGDLRDCFTGYTSEIARGENLVGIHNIDQVMGNTPSLTFRQLGRPYVEMAKNLQRIAIDDFAMELLRDLQRQFALAGTRRTSDSNQWASACVTISGAAVKI